MTGHEKVSYEIKVAAFYNDFLYCDPRSEQTSSKRVELKGSYFFRIDNKLFEIKCPNLDKKSNINFRIFEIDYFETFSKFPLNSSFCIGNIETENFYSSICLFFIYHEQLELIANKEN
ncbi:hypothetical protein DDB_G0290385 [Dictyostelium discoideum AX4]|uniref:Uncharacterized protein n=1 Tax=Dictyostelium discoideum TaxID=44689 RepID=Q54G59_DICDI|nr:hypothetical protein DDB_G0290385 [Dictyostelium discoideum AX4]EAL62208.1 hypothetical protein DDB_G0290385 [Dictyostelium discoideum AX4]|eukprot:XP_635713.1 hypothetical protein DDB_G0290385 [Dictyostelium discoideum AX4]